MPSASVLKSKQEKVAALTELIEKSVSGVLVDYKGITVEDDTKLRRELRGANVHYQVEKNSILGFALANTGRSELNVVLEGTTALALSFDDQTAPARILGEFSDKAGEGKFNLKAGFIDNEIYDSAGVAKLSKIPSKDILLSQLVGSLQGPMQKLAAILKAVADKQEETAA